MGAHGPSAVRPSVEHTSGVKMLGGPDQGPGAGTSIGTAGIVGTSPGRAGGPALTMRVLGAAQQQELEAGGAREPPRAQSQDSKVHVLCTLLRLQTAGSVVSAPSSVLTHCALAVSPTWRPAPVSLCQAVLASPELGGVGGLPHKSGAGSQLGCVQCFLPVMPALRDSVTAVVKNMGHFSEVSLGLHCFEECLSSWVGGSPLARVMIRPWCGLQ